MSRGSDPRMPEMSSATAEVEPKSEEKRFIYNRLDAKKSALLTRGRPRDPRIQGLRGVAMSAVALSHFLAMLQICFQPDSAIRPFLVIMVRAQIGSSIFLLVTGFVVYARCRDGGAFSWGTFLKARMLRILPLYWALLTAYAVLDSVFGICGRVPNDLGAAVTYFLYNAFLLAPLAGKLSLITVSWTLTYVAIGYLMVPWLARSFQRLQLNTAQRGAVILAVVILWGFAPSLWSGLAANGILLAVGMLVYEATQTLPLAKLRPNRFDALTGIAIVAALFILSAPAARGLRLAATAIPLGLLLAGRRLAGGAFNAALVSRTGQWMGKISYSFYFTHGVALIVTRTAIKAAQPSLEGWMPGWVLFMIALPLCCGLSLVVGAAAHHWLETPLQRLLSAEPARQRSTPGIMSSAGVGRRSAIA